MTDILTSARKTIETERDALEALAQSLDLRFVHAVEQMEKASASDKGGRIIVTGVGKSGHIGRKIAATLASTDSPSMFVHPGEASHGDLGMITRHDVVLAISNSGEAPELSDIINYTRRFDIPLIAITSKPASTLAQHANIVLQLPNLPEAGLGGLAPTTSTATTLALGDALAVALLERRGLTPERFSQFHPGGKLGKRLKKVQELMDPVSALPIVAPETGMDKTLLQMTEKNIGCVIIENKDGTVAGIITDGDLKRHMSQNLLSKTAGDIMTANPKSVEPGILAVEALDIMMTKFRQPITSLLVIKDSKLQGLIRIQALLQAGIV